MQEAYSLKAYSFINSIKFLHLLILNAVLFCLIQQSFAVKYPASDDYEGDLWYQKITEKTPAFNQFVKFRVRIPDVPVIRGAVLAMGHNSLDKTIESKYDHYWQMAKSWDFALIGSHVCCDVKYIDPNLRGLKDAVHTIMNRVAEESGHPEMAHVGFLPFGFSEGGVSSYSYNIRDPKRTIGYFAASGSKGGVSCKEGCNTPGIVSYGEKENNAMHWQKMRTQSGARFGYVKQWGIGHKWGKNYKLMLPFFDQVVRMRLPEGATPLSGPIPLNVIPEESGWLGDSENTKNKFPYVAPYSEYKKDKSKASWFPSEHAARMWQSLATNHRTTFMVTEPYADHQIFKIGDQMDVLLTNNGAKYKNFVLYYGSGKSVELSEPGEYYGVKSNDFQQFYSIKVPCEEAGTFGIVAVAEKANGEKEISPIRNYFVHEPNSGSPIASATSSKDFNYRAKAVLKNGNQWTIQLDKGFGNHKSLNIKGQNSLR